MLDPVTTILIETSGSKDPDTVDLEMLHLSSAQVAICLCQLFPLCCLMFSFLNIWHIDMFLLMPFAWESLYIYKSNWDPLGCVF